MTGLDIAILNERLGRDNREFLDYVNQFEPGDRVRIRLPKTGAAKFKKGAPRYGKVYTVIDTIDSNETEGVGFRLKLEGLEEPVMATEVIKVP
jgi:hypothetical protein